MGLKNTLFPQKMLSTDEITAISQKAIGKTGFPEYRGQAFARDFLKAYLNMDNSKASKQLLGKFYTGQLGESDGGLRTGKSAKESQMKVIGEPVLFDSLLVSEKMRHSSLMYIHQTQTERTLIKRDILQVSG